MKLVIATIVYKDHSLKYFPEFLHGLKRATSNLNLKYQIFFGDNSGNDLRNQEYINKQEIISSDLISYFHFGKNLGFAKAYNQLISKAQKIKAQYFLALNPDVLCSKDSISLLIKEMDKDQSLASLAPKILVWKFNRFHLSNNIDSCGLILKKGLIFKDLGQGIYDRGQYDAHRILGPSGAVALYKMSALEDVKVNKQYFDEKFFMYKEDCDLAYRLYLKKYKSKLVADSIFYHDRSVSGGNVFKRLASRFKRSKQERIWSFQGQIYISHKHFKSQSIFNKLMIILNLIKLYTFSLVFERYVLKSK